MKLTRFARFDRGVRSAFWGGVVTVLLLAAGSTVFGDVEPEYRNRNRDAGFGLFAGPTAVLDANQWQCGIQNDGQVCTDVFGSPTAGGGNWPGGTPNQYIFNTGLQIAAIVGDDGGAWAGDTVGGMFFDATGGQLMGTKLSDIYNSLNSEDAADWPGAAGSSPRVDDLGRPLDATIPAPPDPNAELYDEVLHGRSFASQQDSWVRYWEGDPAKLPNRKHPMGVAVEQRSLAWNYPSGNESMIYFVYEFENVTNAEVFRRLNNQQFFGGDPVLPAGGYTLEQMYAAFATDMDVTSVSTTNFSTAILPFDIGLSYHGAFDATGEFVYPPEIFFPPFFTTAPGLVGIKYLRSPTNPETGEQIGLTLFSTTIRQVAGALPDPVGDDQLWRYLSGRLDPALGDTPCDIPAETPASRSLCFIFQQAADTRFYQSSGPFALAPGEKATIVVSYIGAPTVAVMPDGTTSGIEANSANVNANPPGTPSFHPGFLSQRGCDLNGANCTDVVGQAENRIKDIERGAGWFDYFGPPPATTVESPEGKIPVLDPVTDEPLVTVVPGSLLGRALVAQSIFDNRFLLGFAPESPEFWLIPGNQSVTVLWAASASETEGDPFYNIASDPASALYNPNYRGNPEDPDQPTGDVEGYRIWRGNFAGTLEPIAQFDYANTTFKDYTCETVDPNEDAGVTTLNQAEEEVPVFGFASGDICNIDPAAPIERPIVQPGFLPGTGLVFNNGKDGGVPGGGVVRTQALAALATSDLVPLVSEGFDGLSDSGVPFAFTDAGQTTAGALRNNFTYVYAVQAFDINSRASGPASLAGPLQGQSVVPRSDAPNLTLAALEVAVLGDDGEPLVTDAPLPRVNPENGTFDGPFPPTDGFDLSFVPNLARLLPEFTVEAVIDSVKPEFVDLSSCDGWAFFNGCYKMFLTTTTLEGVTESVVAGISGVWSGGFGVGPDVQTVVSAVVPFDQRSLDDFGVPLDAADAATPKGAASAIMTHDESINFMSFEGQQNRRARTANTLHGGSRWFSGTEETVPDPAKYIRVGHLNEVDSVWAPIHHTAQGPGLGAMANSGAVQYFGYFMAFLGRAADVQFTWQGGTFGSVRDITHHVDLPFHPDYRAGTWGFLNGDCDGNNLTDWQDYFCVGEAAETFQLGDNAGLPPNTPGSVLSLEPTPVYHGVSTSTAIPAADQGEQGFALYINGERYIFLGDPANIPDGTVWTLRTYSGSVTASRGVSTDNPGGYAYQRIYDLTSSSVATGTRPAMIPGLRLSFKTEAASRIDAAALDLTQIHTVPDPYLATSALDLAPTEKRLQFVNLPPQATIRIYTLTGILVDQIEHDDITGGGRAVWDLRNRNEQFVASGVYFFHVITPSGDEHVGKFTVVNFASQ